MNTREMQFIVTLADTQNITKAAEQLYISQPALSSFLMALEKQLGYRIFTRGKHLEPTAAGEIYLRYARRMLALDEEYHREMACWEQSVPAVIRVAANNLTFMFYYDLLSRHFQAAFPGVEIQVLPVNAKQARTLLLESGAEFSLGSFLQSEEWLQVERLEPDPYVAAAAANHPILSALPAEGEGFPTVTTEQLRQYPVGIRTPHFEDSSFYTNKIIRTLGFSDDEVIHQPGDITISLKRAGQGDYIHLDCLSFLLPYCSPTLRILKIDPGPCEGESVLGAYNKARLPGPFAQKLVETAGDFVRKLFYR